ncbi:hypothetical protein PENPOL_c018G08730 [Penicillium polonicum]|uniref:Uncharacterized protein n=1 Tax=Penicillium polonicum TaxID=60169 RepID=A0A1V6N9W2_PENPO|nr:hypothetical protein PENPOL_c018G08730 [Penicillium polonicum]
MPPKRTIGRPSNSRPTITKDGYFVPRSLPRHCAQHTAILCHGDDAVKVEILRGGQTRQMKLPDANSVPLHYTSARNLLGGDSDTTIPIVHPSVLILTKIKRWYSFAESTRPQSETKAGGDFEDMTAMLL